MNKKYCKACGKELKRRRLNCGEMETELQFSQRTHCDRDCKHEAMKVEYEYGQVLGDYGLIYLYEATPKMWNNNRIRRAEFKCTCGKTFITNINRVNINGTKSCGCLRAERGRKMCTKHGLAYDRLWHKWHIIKQRIFNPNNIGYKYYGGRGIKMHEGWINDAAAFINYCKTLDGWDNKELTIDRINNDGNYELYNLRFVSHSIQTRNRRMTKKNISGYVGVYPIKDARWKSSISQNHKEIVIYRGKFKVTAAIARDKYIINNNLPGYILNFLSR